MYREREHSFYLFLIPVKDPITMPAMPIKSIHEQSVQVAVIRRLKKVQISNVVQIRGPLLCDAEYHYPYVLSANSSYQAATINGTNMQ